MKEVTNLKLPNVYRAEIGFMDLTVNEVTDLICQKGLRVNPTEVTRAIRGGSDPKHYSIRCMLSDIFNDWCRLMNTELGIKPEISLSYDIEYGRERQLKSFE